MRSVQRKNFGHNLVLRPTAICTPANEQEVLEILDQNRGQQIRAIGKLHLAANQQHSAVEIRIAVIHADQLAHAQAGRIERFQNRPVAQSHRLFL